MIADKSKGGRPPAPPGLRRVIHSLTGALNMTNIDTRYSEELAWCAGLLSGDRAKVKMTGAGNEADYLEVQALGARRHGQRDASIAFQAAANHWRDGSHKSAIEILRQAIA